jgi:hypothetical protein
LVQSISAVGDGLWVFQVLPNTPSLLVPLFFLTLGWAPGALRSLIDGTMGSSRLRYIRPILTCLASLGLILFPLYTYLLTQPDRQHPTSHFLFLAVSIFCSSLRWWPSYLSIADVRRSEDLLVNQPREAGSAQNNSSVTRYILFIGAISRKFKWYLLDTLKDLENCRYSVYTYIAIAELIIYGLLCNALLPNPLFFNQVKYNEAFSQLQPMLFKFWWVPANIVGTYIAYLIGKTMCKVTFRLASL